MVQQLPEAAGKKCWNHGFGMFLWGTHKAYSWIPLHVWIGHSPKYLGIIGSSPNECWAAEMRILEVRSRTPWLIGVCLRGVCACLRHVSYLFVLSVASHPAHFLPSPSSRCQRGSLMARIKLLAVGHRITCRQHSHGDEMRL